MHTRLATLALLALALLGIVSAAPVPTVTVEIETTVLVTDIEFELFFEQTGDATGYGPYIDLIVSANEFTYDSVSFRSLGSDIAFDVVEFNSNTSVAHPFAVLNESVPIIIEGTPNDVLFSLRLPYSSVVVGQPQITIDVSGLALVGTEADMAASGGFRYGSDSDDNPAVDPSIQGPEIFFGVNQRDYLFTRERWPWWATVGPTYKRTIAWKLDVAEGAQVDNVHLVHDFDSNVVLESIDFGTGSVILSSPPLGQTFGPGNNTLIVYLGDITGVSSLEVYGTVVFHYPCVDFYGEPLVSAYTGDSVYISVGTSWLEATGFNGTDVGSFVNNYQFRISSVTYYTQTFMETNKGVSGYSPGDVVEHQMMWTISECFAFTNLFVVGHVYDGFNVQTGYGARIEVDGMGSTHVYDGSGMFLVDKSEVGTGSGRTYVTVQVSDALASGLNATYVDGYRRVRAFFRSVVREAYTDSPAGGVVAQGDLLFYTALYSGTIINTTSHEVYSSESGWAGRDKYIPTGSATVDYAYVNGDACPCDAAVEPAFELTVHFQYYLPTGDVRGLSFAVFLPDPLLTSAEVSAGSLVSGMDQPLSGDYGLTPNDTLGRVPNVTVNGVGENTVFFDFGAFNDSESLGDVIDLALTLRVTSEPYPDRQPVSILVEAEELGVSPTSLAALQLIVSQPEVHFAKGAVGSSRAGAVFNPSNTGYVVGSCPSGSGLTVASLNSNPVGSSVSGVCAGDIVTFAIVVRNTGHARGYDVTVRDSVPRGLQIPVDGLGLCAQTGEGVAVATVGDLFSSSGLVLVQDVGWGGLAAGYDGNDNEELGGAPVVVITYNLLVTNETQFGDVANSTTALLSYSNGDGGFNFILSPDITPPEPITTTTTSATPAFAATAYTYTTSLAETADSDVAVGEEVSITYYVDVPRGSSDVFTIDLSVPSHVTILAAYVSDIEEPMTAAGLGDGESAQSIGATSVSFEFGRLTNPASSTSGGNQDPRTVAVTVEVALSNAGVATGTSLAFGASVTWTESGDSTATALSLTAVKPVVRTTASITSSLSPDEGDLFEFTFNVDHPGSSHAPVYDVVVTIPQPTQLLNSALTISSGFPGFAVVEGSSAADDEIVVTVPLLDVADTLTVTVEGDLTDCTARDTIQLTSSVTSESCPSALLPSGVSSYTATDSGSTATATVPQPTINSAAVVNSSFVYAVLPDVVVGESVTYEFVVYLVEGYQELVLDVVLPRANGGATMEVVSSEVVSLGAATGSALVEGASGTANNAAAHDALNDEVRFDLGTVFNPGNNALSDDDMLVFRVVARVSDVSGNAEGTSLVVSSTLRRSDEASVDTASTSAVTVREPTVSVVANDDATSSSDAGDTLTFTATVTTGGNADGFDTTVTLALPSYVDLVVGSVTLTIDGAAGGSVTLGNTGGDTTAAGYVARVQQSVSTLVLTAQGVVQANAPAHTTSSASAGVETYSTSAAHGFGRTYTAANSHALELLPPLTGTIALRNSSLALTTAAQFNTGREDFAMGELVFYDASFTTMEGTSSPVVTFTFSDGSPSSHGIIVPQAFAKVSKFGADTSSSALTSWSSGTVAGDKVTFDFGVLSNSPDNAVNGGDIVHFLLAARVVYDSGNVAGDQLRNTMEVTYSDSSFTEFVRSEAVRAVPSVSVASDVATTYVVAGSTVTFDMTIGHDASSTAPLYDVVATFNIPTSYSSVSPLSASVDNGGVVSAANADYVTVTVDAIDVGTTVTLYVDVELDAAIPFNSVLDFDWAVTAVSAPAPHPSVESFSLSDSTALRTEVPVFQTPTEVATSWSETTSPDVAIGETITYSVTVDFPIGTATNAEYEFTLDSGLAIVAVDGVTTAGPLSLSEPASAAALLSAITVRAGGSGFDIPSTLDLVSSGSSSLTIEFTAIVLDDDTNCVRGTSLGGDVTSTFGLASPSTALPDRVVVEPTLSVSIANEAVAIRRNSSFTSTISLDHTGVSDAPAVQTRFNVTVPWYAHFQSATLVNAPTGTTVSGVGTSQLFVDATASYLAVADPVFDVDAVIFVRGGPDVPFGGDLGPVVVAQWRSLEGLTAPGSVHNADSYPREYTTDATTSTEVDTPPDVANDVIAAVEGNTTTINVVANDIDVDGNVDPSSVAIAVAPLHGIAVAPSADSTCIGCIDYTPFDEYTGDDVLWYRVCDDLLECAVTYVNITVQEVNDLPTISLPIDLAIEVPQEIRWPVPGISTADVDEKGSVMTATVTAAAGVVDIDPFSGVTFVDSTANGGSTITFDGTLAQLNTALASLHYTGGVGVFGTDTLTVIVDDNGNTGIGPWTQRRRDVVILVDKTEAVVGATYFYSPNLKPNLPAGTEVIVYIQPVDKFGNNVTAQYDAFSLALTPSVGGETVTAVASVAATGTRLVAYLNATIQGTYDLTVTLDGVGQLPDSPVTDIEIEPIVYYKPTSSFASAAFDAPTHAGDVATATVTLADRYTNVYWAQPETEVVVRLVADGGTPGGAPAGLSVPVSITDNANGVFDLSFNATTAGPYTLAADVVVGGTTLFTLGPEPLYVDAPATHLVYTTQPPAVVEAGVRFNVTLAARDRFGNYDVDLVSNIAITVSNAEGANIPIVGTTLQPLERGSVAYLISVYTADVNSTYTITAAAGGDGAHLPLVVSSDFVVEPGIYDPPSTFTSGSGFVGGDAGESLTGAFTLVDVLLNPAYFHPTSVVPHLTGNDGQPDGVVSIDRSVTEWSFEYSVTVTGSYDLIFDVIHNGSLIFQLGPYDVNIHTTAIKLEVVTQPPGSVRVGDDFVVEVAAVDQWSNIDIDVSTHSIALALVSAEWPSAVVVNGAGVGGAPVVALDAGVASFTLTAVTASDPHDFVINAVSPGSSGLGDVDTDSFLTYARYPTYANSTVVGAIVAAGDAGTDITGTLSLIDVFGNAYLAGIDNVNMTFELVGSPGFDTSSVVFPAVTPLGNGQYALSTNITLTGDYSFTVNVAVSGGPALTLGPFTLTVNTVFTRLVWTLNPPATTTAGASFPLTVSALDDYGNVDVDVEAFDIRVGVQYADSAAAAAAAAAGVALGVTTVAHVGGVSDYTLSIEVTGSYVLNATVSGVSPSSTSLGVTTLPTVYSTAVQIVNSDFGSSTLSGEVIDGPLLAGATGTADAWLVDVLDNGYAVPTLAVSATFVSLFDSGSVSVPVAVTANTNVPGLYTLAMTPTVVGNYVLTLTVEELGSVIDLINATVTVHTIGTAIKTLASPPEVVFVGETFTSLFAIVDIFNNIDVDAVYDASVELVHESGFVTPLNGVTSVPVVGGLAAYTGLSSDVSGGPGETFTLRVTATDTARAGDLGPHSSDPFTIKPLPAHGPNTVVTHCALNADGGTAAGTGCTTTVELYDEYGNYHHSTNTSVVGVLESNFGGADVAVSVTTDGAGVWELTYYTTVPGEYTLAIDVVDETGDVVFTQHTARTVTVTATWLDIVTAPTVVVAGESFDVVAVARDVYGNIDTDPHTLAALISTHYGSSTLRSGVAVEALVPPHNTSGVFAVSMVLTVAGDYSLTVVDSQSDTNPAIAHDNRTFVVAAAEPSMTVSHASVVGGAGEYNENTPATLGALPLDAFGNPTLGRNWTVTEVHADSESSAYYNESGVRSSSSSSSSNGSESEGVWSGGWVVAVYNATDDNLVSETLITLTNYSWPGHQVNVSIESVVEPATYSPGTYTAVIEYYGARLSGSVYTFSTYEAPVEVVAVVAVDPDNGDNEYSDGDVVVAFFNTHTNEPNVSTPAQFARVFEWNANMGTALSAFWTTAGNATELSELEQVSFPANLSLTASVLVITVNDADGASDDDTDIGELELVFAYKGHESVLCDSLDSYYYTYTYSSGSVYNASLTATSSSNHTNTSVVVVERECANPLLTHNAFSVAATGANLVTGNWGTFAGQQVEGDGGGIDDPVAPICAVGSISCAMLATILGGFGMMLACCCFFFGGALWRRREAEEVVFVENGDWVWVEFLVGTKQIYGWKDSYAWYEAEAWSDGGDFETELNPLYDEESSGLSSFSSCEEGMSVIPILLEPDCRDSYLDCSSTSSSAADGGGGGLMPISDPLSLIKGSFESITDYEYWVKEYERLFGAATETEQLGMTREIESAVARVVLERSSNGESFDDDDKLDMTTEMKAIMAMVAWSKSQQINGLTPPGAGASSVSINESFESIERVKSNFNLDMTAEMELIIARVSADKSLANIAISHGDSLVSVPSEDAAAPASKPTSNRTGSNSSGGKGVKKASMGSSLSPYAAKLPRKTAPRSGARTSATLAVNSTSNRNGSKPRPTQPRGAVKAAAAANGSSRGGPNTTNNTDAGSVRAASKQATLNEPVVPGGARKRRPSFSKPSHDGGSVGNNSSKRNSSGSDSSCNTATTTTTTTTTTATTNVDVNTTATATATANNDAHVAVLERSDSSSSVLSFTSTEDASHFYLSTSDARTGGGAVSPGGAMRVVTHNSALKEMSVARGTGINGPKFGKRRRNSFSVGVSRDEVAGAEAAGAAAAGIFGGSHSDERVPAGGSGNVRVGGVGVLNERTVAGKRGMTGPKFGGRRRNSVAGVATPPSQGRERSTSSSTTTTNTTTTRNVSSSNNAERTLENVLEEMSVANVDSTESVPGSAAPAALTPTSTTTTTTTTTSGSSGKHAESSATLGGVMRINETAGLRDINVRKGSGMSGPNFGKKPRGGLARGDTSSELPPVSGGVGGSGGSNNSPRQDASLLASANANGVAMGGSGGMGGGDGGGTVGGKGLVINGAPGLNDDMRLGHKRTMSKPTFGKRKK